MNLWPTFQLDISVVVVILFVVFVLTPTIMEVNPVVAWALTPTSPSPTTTLVVGLNAALQKRLILPSPLVPGEVHRATTVQVGVGGKGQDVVLALSCLDYGQGVQLAQFVGQGAAGDALCQVLQQEQEQQHTNKRETQQDRDYWLACTVRSEAPLRTCTSLVDSETTTELVEPSGTITGAEYQQLLTKVRTKATAVDAVCFMGSLPPGCPETTYATVLETVFVSSSSTFNTQQPPPLLCVIDSVVGLESLFHTQATKRRRHHHDNHHAGAGDNVRCIRALWKVNVSELFRVSGFQTDSSTTKSLPQRILQAIRALIQQWPQTEHALDAIAISNGGKERRVGLSFCWFLQGSCFCWMKFGPQSVIGSPISLCIQGYSQVSSKRPLRRETRCFILFVTAQDAYFVSLPPVRGTDDDDDQQNTARVLHLYQIGIPSLAQIQQPILYPIGAGDAVAAGTLAAWSSLSSSMPKQQQQQEEDENPSVDVHVLPAALHDTLQQLERHIQPSIHETDHHPHTMIPLLTSVVFGIACGTASCLQESNSVLKQHHVHQFCRDLMQRPPTWVATASLLVEHETLIHE